MPKIINIENVGYSYPRTKKKALENINLSIDEGEFLALMGENGAGKTTLLRLINGIIPHSLGGSFQGSVTVDGENVENSTVARLALKVGMVLDDPDAQLFTSTVFEEAAFGPENLLLSEQDIRERIDFALEAVGLGGLLFKERKTSTLSGGEKQRLAIACALAMKSKILVLDEPLCRLDPEGAAEVMSVIADLRKKFQTTVIMASHESKMMAEFADRVCILKEGRVVACDSTEKIFANSSLLETHNIQPPVNLDYRSVFPNKINSPSSSSPSRLCVFAPLRESFLNNSSLNPAIEIKSFCFNYGPDIQIENINLTVMNGDFTAIVGKNGCGKTTLLKNITGLLRPSSGEIFVHGKNVQELSVSEISKEIGFVMQNPDNQLFTDSIFKEVSFALHNANFSKEEINLRVKQALGILELDDADAFPHALSRADRTKTVIACVLAMNCKIIIFDEVDVGQDYKGSRQIMNIVKELHNKGFTILFVTHNMSLACEYANKLVIMNKNGAEVFEN